jgi:hypothetical protein
MPSKFGKQYKVPPEFPSLLKAFTREVLRAQPGDIYEFGAQYFTEMVEQEVAARQADENRPRRLSPEKLQELLENMFREADVDDSGALSVAEFRVCPFSHRFPAARTCRSLYGNGHMRAATWLGRPPWSSAMWHAAAGCLAHPSRSRGTLRCRCVQTLLKHADLGLSQNELKLVMREADVNSDGEISYEEFVPLAVDLVTSLYAKMEADAEKASDEEAARNMAETHLLHGMTKEQVPTAGFDYRAAQCHPAAHRDSAAMAAIVEGCHAHDWVGLLVTPLAGASFRLRWRRP